MECETLIGNRFIMLANMKERITFLSVMKRTGLTSINDDDVRLDSTESSSKCLVKVDS